MKYTITLLIVFLNFLCAYSQTEFLDSLYTVETSTHTYLKLNKKDSLQLDFYKPIGVVKKLPLLLYVHGGGFSGGVRDDSNTVQFATKMAEKGYAVASISYQLIMKKLGFGCATKTKEKIKAFNTAAEDISLAIKFILKNDNIFNIDEDKVVISGTSAGAEAVLHLAYVYENRILPRKFKLAGVIGLAGAITTLERIDSDKAIPTQLFHGTNDNLVPYHIAAHHYCSPSDKGYMMLYGSRAIADRLKGLGKPYYLFSINGGTHSWSGIPMSRCVSEVTDFLYNDVLNNAKRQTERTIGF
ncbi:acetyl esterase/lipase [Winogradskyella wandonensis]|uniref:Acetyl esterase/lipase n=1 Tax=Winogradskyella wandonensis TaxID=1442586 RepID=A0A4R1KW16_9FLAO|nr:alpha/beta hydrolase [Winogradskyella wandonensis]TCK69406.1 acetyl esterase/lipase [Winogradskyella wandonensis]